LFISSLLTFNKTVHEAIKLLMVSILSMVVSFQQTGAEQISSFLHLFFIDIFIKTVYKTVDGRHPPKRSVLSNKLKLETNVMLPLSI